MRGLTIAVLARSLATFRGGVDTYVESLIRHAGPLARLRGHRLLAYVDDAEVARRIERLGGEAVLVPMGFTGRLGWDHVWSPLRARADAVDVLVCPRSQRPLAAPCASVTLIYDLMYFDMREHMQPSDNGAYIRAINRLATHRSDAIGVFSAFTRDRLLANLPRVDPTTVRVLAPGPPEAAFGPLDAAIVRATLARLGATRPFALAIGAHPRKNVQVTLDALAGVGRRDLRLVVVTGSASAHQVRLLESHSRKLGLAERVRFLGHLATGDLAALYCGASVLVYASAYEGIGMPPLEAMACGCPVVATAAASIPEVVGDAAITVAPRDVGALAAAMESLTFEAGPAEGLRRRGRERVALFDWDVTAAGLLDMIEEARRRRSSRRVA